MRIKGAKSHDLAHPLRIPRPFNEGKTIWFVKENVMGNRDAHRREKKKPKKKEAKQIGTPSRLFREYRPVSPPQTGRTENEKS